MDIRKNIIWIIIGILIFILGWIFPVEGPIDYMYDNYASQPAVRRPHKGCPAPAPKIHELYEDYNEDGIPEWYQLVPLFEVEE